MQLEVTAGNGSQQPDWTVFHGLLVVWMLLDYFSKCRMAFLRDRSVFCIPNSILRPGERYVIGSISMVTSIVGFLGAALQVKSLRQYRNRQRRRPSPNPNIIFYIAISDLIACLGVFALAIALMSLETPQYIHNVYSRRYNDIYTPLGTTIEVITLFAYLASYVWTLSYVLDMLFQVNRIEIPMVVYHIIAWMIPLELVVIIEGVNLSQYPDICEGYYGRLSRLILSYFPVMTVMFVNPVLFLFTYKKIKRQLRSSGRFTVDDRHALNRCRKKFLWMILAFTACGGENLVPRLQSIHALKNPHVVVVGFILHMFYSKDLKFVGYRRERKELQNRAALFLKAFLNPLQGIFNYFVYRHSFKVTTTDTWPGKNPLPRAPRARLFREYIDKRFQSILSSNQTVQGSDPAEPPTGCDENSPLLPPASNTDVPPYVYSSRLLGE